MRCLKLFGVGLVALFTLALTSSSFAQLPDISVALGGTYPLHLEVTALNGRTELQTEGFESLVGTGLLLLLLAAQLTSLGSFELLFTSVLRPGPAQPVSCFSENGTTKDGTGLVLTLGTFHIVLVPPHGSLGLLFLLQPLKIICGAVTIRIRGSALSLITNATGTEGSEYSALTGALKGFNGVPEVDEYLNEGGTIIDAHLEADFGIEFMGAAESLAGEVMATALEGKMFVIKPH